MKNEKLKGIIAPITTPFLETGEVNYEGLKQCPILRQIRY